MTKRKGKNTRKRKTNESSKRLSTTFLTPNNDEQKQKQNQEKKANYYLFGFFIVFICILLVIVIKFSPFFSSKVDKKQNKGTQGTEEKNARYIPQPVTNGIKDYFWVIISLLCVFLLFLLFKLFSLAKIIKEKEEIIKSTTKLRDNLGITIGQIDENFGIDDLLKDIDNKNYVKKSLRQIEKVEEKSFVDFDKKWKDMSLEKKEKILRYLLYYDAYTKELKNENYSLDDLFKIQGINKNLAERVDLLINPTQAVHKVMDVYEPEEDLIIFLNEIKK